MTAVTINLFCPLIALMFCFFVVSLSRWLNRRWLFFMRACTCVCVKQNQQVNSHAITMQGFDKQNQQVNSHAITMQGFAKQNQQENSHAITMQGFAKQTKSTSKLSCKHNARFC